MKHPLLADMDIEGSRDILLNITGGMDMTLFEMEEVMNTVQTAAGQTNIIMGTVLDESLDGMIRVTLIATGLDRSATSHDEMLARNILKFQPDRPDGLETSAFKKVKRNGFDTEEVVGGEPSDDAIEKNGLDVPTYMRRRRSFGS